MLWLYLLLTIVVGGLIIGAIVKIQWIDGTEWRKRAENKVETVRVDQAHRGNIYSSDGKILATTIPVCDLYLDLGLWQKKDKHGNPLFDNSHRPLMEGPINDSLFYASLDSVCIVLSNDLPGRSRSYFREKILAGRRRERPARCLLVARAIPYSTWATIREFKGWDRGVLKTVEYDNGERDVVRQERAHVYGNMAKNVIGFKNSLVSNSYTGIEGYYDTLLRGQDGLYRYRRLTRGTWLRDANADADDYYHDGLTLDSVSNQKRIDGLDIVATIDTRYQDIAETALHEQLARYGASSGCAILMEVATGYVLACSSLTLDTATHQYTESVDNNVACSDLYEPGSTFKTVFLTALFDDSGKKADTNDRIRIKHKVFSLTSGEIRDDEDRSDSATVKRAFAISSNVGMCELAWKYYRDERNKLKERIEKMVPYEPLMLDLRANEPRGKINELKSDRGFLNFCYGYNSNLTPLQLLTFYNALAGEGRMVKPLFCRATRHKGRMRETKPKVLDRHICKPETARLMTELLVEVVQNGTANNIRNTNYSIAGKTGTAKAYNTRTRQYYPNLYNASFAGFFPAETPKYSCIVVVKNVNAHGRQAAAPVFRRIADCAMSIDKELSHIHFDETADSSIVRPTRKVSHRETALDRMPNCKGLTAREAIALLEKCRMEVTIQGYGKVFRQSPEAGSKIQPRQKAKLQLQ